MSTADAADDFIRQQRDAASAAAAAAQRQRQACWDELIGLFRTARPDDTALGKVSLIAEVAIDQVFSAHRLDGEAAQREHGKVKDYAECSALYGYVLGMADARRQVLRALGSTGD
jgi:hypothetical protein